MILKRYRKRPSSIKAIKYQLLGIFGCEIPVEYQSAKQRLEFERATLKLWRDRGFRVPCTKESVPPANGTELLMSHVEGPTLEQFLKSREVDISEKWKAIDLVFTDLRARHCLALYEEDWRLIHFDSNVRNILLTKDGPARVDFEMGRRNEKIIRSAAREIQKLSLEIANILGRIHFTKLIDRIIRHYGITNIFRFISDSEFNRLFSWFHRRNDFLKKKKNSEIITKLDLAHAIRDAMTGSTKKRGELLDQAESTSWDGKFYQAFDDADRRGRDMPHRYQMMGFPERFDGSSILDIGCNLGRCCIDAAKKGAVRSIGLDFRPDVMEAVTEYCVQNEIPARFHVFDVDDGLSGLQKIIGSEKFDFVCALSIWSHVNQEKLWEIINNVTGRVCFFEDNYPSRVKSLSKMEAILRKNLSFNSYDFLGFTTDRGIRAVFRLAR